jgi:cytochrome c peroxidase
MNHADGNKIRIVSTQSITIALGLFALLALTLNFANRDKTKLTEVQLGEKLFFEKTLSLDSTISCASCHKPEFGFADNVPFSIGVGGKKGKRNAPAVMNMIGRDLLFFDGRAKDLEDQVHFPIEDANEMNLSYTIAIARLNRNKQYRKWFSEVYKDKPTKENVALAIAAFERSMETNNTLFDHRTDKTKTQMSASAERGRALFVGSKAKCFDCHFTPDFTGDEFRNIGLYDGVVRKDAGRFDITKDSSDLGKFKVPGLRNIAVTGPYMHDGSMKTLREVIDYYDNPFKTIANPINIDTLLQKPLGLSEQEKQDLEAFLNALTDERFIKK